jgi:hypothetical protein
MLTTENCSHLRSHLVLVHYDARLALLTVLLRVPERSDTRTRLAELGFEPEQTDRANAISWKRETCASSLAVTSGTLVAALRDEAVLDLGSHASDAGGSVHASFRQEDLPSFWPGRFMVRIGGPRCVVFDRGSNDAEIRRLIVEQDRDYYLNDFAPATE